MLRSPSGSRTTKYTLAFVGALSASAVALAGCSSQAADSASEPAAAVSALESQLATASPEEAKEIKKKIKKEKQKAKATASASAKASASKSSSKKPSSSYNMNSSSKSKNSSKSKGTTPTTSSAKSKGTSSSAAKKPSYTINPRITVSKTSGLKNGDYVTVSGTGFDNTKGIYIAFCVITGGKPSPCGGGADTDGDSSKSEWISSNPPTYGKGLAVPFRANGSFSVRIKVSEKIGSFDCSNGGCGVATRADHTRSGDRSSDRWVRVTFA